MDAKPASSLTVIAVLVALCAGVTAVGLSWPAWDMFGPERRPMLQGWDDSFYYFWLPSVVIDHDVDFSNQLANSGTIDPATRDLALTRPRTPTGLVDAKYPPGWAIASLPFFLVAHVFSGPHATGFEPVYLVMVWLGQGFYAFVGAWLAIKILERYFSPTLALIAFLSAWLASPLVYYQTARLSMSHSQVFTLAMATFWLALRISDRGGRRADWAALGFVSALLVVTRNVAVVYLLLPALVVIRQGRSLLAIGWLLIGAAAPVAAQLLAWKALYGKWIAYSYGGERFDFRQLHLGSILFSPRHGWFYWHPLMLVGMAGFVAWAWHRTEGRAWLISLGVAILLSAAWPMWWLGSSFGYRGLEIATFFAAIGLAVLLEATRRHAVARGVLAAVIAVAVLWNVAMFGLFLTQRIPREGPVTYAQAIEALRNRTRQAR
jgi:hypothetical protein